MEEEGPVVGRVVLGTRRTGPEGQSKILCGGQIGDRPVRRLFWLAAQWAKLLKGQPLLGGEELSSLAHPHWMVGSADHIQVERSSDSVQGAA